MMQKGDLNFGDIVWTEFDPSVGHEYQDKRPAIVIESDEQLKNTNLVTIIPLTSRNNNIMFDDVIIKADSNNRLRVDSIAKVYCIASFDYCRFFKRIGKINEASATIIKRYLKKHFNI